MSAQTNMPFSFQRITSQQGLAPGKIDVLFQDSHGFSWVATQEGLQRFDGYELVSFKHEPFDPHTLSGNHITEITEDVYGDLWLIANGVLNRYARAEDMFYRYDLAQTNTGAGQALALFADPPKTGYHEGKHRDEVWVGTRNRGLYRYDRERDSFEAYLHDPDNFESLSSNLVSHIHRDRRGGLWISTYGGGLNKYLPDSDTFSRFLDPGTIDVLSLVGYHKIPPKRHQAPMVEIEDQLFIITHGGGLIRFDLIEETYIQYRHIPSEPQSISDNVVYTLFRDGLDRLWLATEAGGLDLFDPRSGAFKKYRHDPDNPYSLADTNFGEAVFALDTQDRLWIGTPGHGVNLLYPNSERFFRLQHDASRRDSLSDDHITALAVDRAETVWIGTKSAGLSKFSRFRHKFRLITGDPERENSLPNDQITAITDAPGNDTLIWLGTLQSGVLGFSTLSGRVIHHATAESNTSTGLASDHITVLLYDADGNLWIGTPAGLSRLNLSNRTFPRFTRANSELTSNYIMSLAEARDGGVWVGTTGSVLHRFDPENQQFEAIDLKSGDQSLVERGAIVDIVRDGEGHLWLANRGVGLIRYHPDEGKTRLFRHDITRQDSLSHDGVSAVHIDGHGGLWVGTQGGGLNRYRWETAGFEHYTLRDSLASNIIYDILESSDGNLWLCTSLGLTSFDPRRGEVIHYDSGDGLIGNSAFAHGFFRRDRDDTFFFGGINGFNQFKPTELSTNPHPPPIVLTGVNVLGQPLRPFDPNHIVELDHNRNFLEIKWSALDFTYTEKNQYYYQLKGLDTHMQFSGTKREVTYTNLDPGTYTFRVIGANNDGIWNEEGATLAIRIRPPFWQTWWFYGIEVVLVISLLFLGFLAQRRRLESQQQEALVELELKRKTEELDYARRIQLSMLPRDNVDNEVFEAVGAMRTATEVGGDYYDFLELDSSRFCIAVGDATGHGFAAGLVVGMTKLGSMVWALGKGSSLVDMIQELNRGLKKSLTERTMGMSLGISVLDLESRHVQMAFAGMPFPYHFCAKSHTLKPLVMKGPPLGFLERIPVASQELTLEPDDYLIFYSDGFPERFNRENQLWGQEKVAQTLQRICRLGGSAQTVAHQFFEACDLFADGRTHDDDMTVVVVRMKPQPPSSPTNDVSE
ncbi:SpoIIE family protein phosphatase [Sulfidibacter corallicola]